MSNFFGLAKHPKTNRWQEAEFLDDALGKHRYGIRFRRDRDGVIHDSDKVVTLQTSGYTPVYNAFIEWADKYSRWHANPLAGAEFLNELEEQNAKN